MTFTSEERREMAENLRHLTIGHSIQYKEQFFDELAEVVVGFEDYQTSMLSSISSLISLTRKGEAMINDEERKRAVAELREASTGAYRHVDSLDVIANSIGVEVDGKFIDVPDGELTDGWRPLGKMTLAEVLDIIAENPRRFIEQYEMYREEVVRLGGKL